MGMSKIILKLTGCFSSLEGWGPQLLRFPRVRWVFLSQWGELRASTETPPRKTRTWSDQSVLFLQVHSLIQFSAHFFLTKMWRQILPKPQVTANKNAHNFGHSFSCSFTLCDSFCSELKKPLSHWQHWFTTMHAVFGLFWPPPSPCTHLDDPP